MTSPSIWAGASPEQLAIFQEVFHERARQDLAWGVQDHPVEEQLLAGWPKPHDQKLVAEALARRQEKERGARERVEFRAKAGTLSWVDILQEELQEVNGAPTSEAQRAELVQLAAVAVAAIESIDRRAGP